MARFGAVILATLLLLPVGAWNAGPARAAKQIVHIEWLPMVSGSACAISSTCPAVSNGNRVSRGIRVDQSSHAEIRLDGRFQDLYGTLYLDDASTSTYGTTSVAFLDSSDEASRTTLQTIGVAPRQGSPFAFSVRGVRALYISLTSIGHAVVDVVASLTTNAPSPQPTAARPAVTPLYPANGTGVPAGSKVLFAWRPFPGAANYAFHIWMVSRSGSAPLPAAAPLTFSSTIHHGTSYVWNDRGFLAGVYQYQILPIDAMGNALGAWSRPVQISVVG